MRFQVIALIALATICNHGSGQRIETTEIANNRFFFSDSSPYTPRLNWFLAYQYCRNIGMDLLSMPQQEEAIQLIDFLTTNRKFKNSYWTSGNQLGSHMWIWMATGQPYNSTFNFWSQNGPPLTKSQKGCMGFEAGVWSAYNCMDEKAFICHLTRCYFFNYAAPSRRRGQNLQGAKRSKPTRNTSTLSPLKKMQPIPNLSASKLNQEGLQKDSANSFSNSQSQISHQISQSNRNEDSTAFNQQQPAPTTHTELNQRKVMQAKVIPIRGTPIQGSRLPPISDQPNHQLHSNLAKQNEIISREISLPQQLLPPSVGSQSDLGTAERTQRHATTTVEEPEQRHIRRLQRKEEFKWAFAGK